MTDELRFQRRQARMTVISALRVIRDLQLSYDIPTSEVLNALAFIYRDIAYYNSFKWVKFAAKQIRKEEQGGHS